MRYNQSNQAHNINDVVVLASGAGNALPPTNFVDTLLGNLFPEQESNNDHLAPFDYEAFLRREGLL